MFRLADDLRVYLHRDPIDFRAGINSLAILVEQAMGLNPFERAVFAFCNRRRTRMKLLFFDRSGFVLVLKALTEDKFRWPRRQETVVTLDDRAIALAARRHRSRRDGPPSGAAISNLSGERCAVDAGGGFRFKNAMNRTGTPTVAELMALLAAHAAEIAALKAERDVLAQRVFKLEEELALARLHRFAPRSEKHMDRVFNEAEQSAVEGERRGLRRDGCRRSAGHGIAGRPKSRTARNAAAGPCRQNLPRERVEYDLADDQKVCPCCSHPMHRMGELVTEQLHIEVKAKVLQNARFKYACRHCDRTGINTPVVIAPMPAQPLPGSIATASTLAFALVHKYVDGTPLYRLAQAFERAGVPVSRGALGHWVIGSSERHLHSPL